VNDALEATIREHHERGDHRAAVTAALEGYGREVMGFLFVRLRDEARAADVFSQLGEDVWKGIGGFGWRSSFRTWLYVLARNAAYREEQHAKKNRNVPLSEISDVVQRVRTETLPYLRTEAKDRLQELRASLDPEDQQLLVLRIKRRLSWKEIAAIMSGTEDLDDEEVARASARYRQRFKKLKDRLRDQAEQAGLLRRD
jgi:RNA polymerase sigma-70 factor (ECF subfamily)